MTPAKEGRPTAHPRAFSESFGTDKRTDGIVQDTEKEKQGHYSNTMSTGGVCHGFCHLLGL